MQGFILAAVTAAEKCTLILDDVKYWSVKYRSRSWCMLEEYVKDNYYAMFHILHMQNLRVFIIFLISAQKDVCGTVSSMLSGLKTRSLGLNTLGTT